MNRIILSWLFYLTAICHMQSCLGDESKTAGINLHVGITTYSEVLAGSASYLVESMPSGDKSIYLKPQSSKIKSAKTVKGYDGKYLHNARSGANGLRLDFNNENLLSSIWIVHID